ncbi:MAG TPA: hypothetical protein PLZ93_00560 [Nocardioides sp.]|uniref:hypothetical protein n=1 Tax=uncultured Nocardioides sp. TaxID=198441 RepID=UPI00261AE668|nr:hypothetical protein [uncultured Nocardioides sp.]HRD60443.1 hypothetical protein [Nocardioides sp.]HRI94083.1 hypothetical protein [Nocardioides sp.]HRK44110.1 hypothetical protein [Nocardioides sp.]
MAVSTRVRVILLLALALVFAVSGALVATSTAAPHREVDRQAGTLLTYHGTESRAVLPLGADRLRGAPPSFRRFVKQQLRDIWAALGHTPACKTSPIIRVKAVRTDGFATGSVVTRPRRNCTAFGGHAAIWAVRHGQWKEVIGHQDLPPCSKLIKFEIPSEIGVHECFESGTNAIVPYEHP